jgi:signal peptidase I
MPTITTSAPSLHWTRRTSVFVALLVSAAAACAWAVALAPQSLGGPAGYVIVAGNSMEPRLSNGDLAIVRERPTYHVGDVVAYRVPSGEAGAGSLVIHRIVGGSASRGYRLQGDNRSGTDIWTPKQADVAGSLWWSVPHGGVVFHLLRAPVALAAFSALIVFVLVARPGRWKRRWRSDIM